MPRCACNPHPRNKAATCCNYYCCTDFVSTPSKGEAQPLLSAQTPAIPSSKDSRYRNAENQFTEKGALILFDDLLTQHAATTCGADCYYCTTPPSLSNAFPPAKPKCCGYDCCSYCMGCNQYCALHFHCQTWNKLLYDCCTPKLGFVTATWIMLFAAGTSSLAGPAGMFYPKDYHSAGCHDWVTGGRPCHGLDKTWGWGHRLTKHPVNVVMGVFAGLTSAGIKYRGAPTAPDSCSFTRCKESCLTSLLPDTQDCSQPGSWTSFVMICSLLGGLSSGGLSYIGLLGLSGSPAVAGGGALANCCASTFLGCHSFDKLKDTVGDVKENGRWMALVFSTLWSMTAIIGKIGLAADVIVHFMHGYYLAALAAGVASNIAFGILIGIAVFRIVTYIDEDIKEIIRAKQCTPSICVFLACSFIISSIGCFDYGGLNNIVFDKCWKIKNMPFLDALIKRLLAVITGIPRGMLIEMSLLKVFKAAMEAAPQIHERFKTPGSLPDYLIHGPHISQQPGVSGSPAAVAASVGLNGSGSTRPVVTRQPSHITMTPPPSPPLKPQRSTPTHPNGDSTT